MARVGQGSSSLLKNEFSKVDFPHFSCPTKRKCASLDFDGCSSLVSVSIPKFININDIGIQRGVKVTMI